MLKIDKSIYDINKNICENIRLFPLKDRGFVSQNILAQLRNFVEYVAIKIYSHGTDIEPNVYANNVKALEFIKRIGQYSFIHKFHDLLQISDSHYTFDEDTSERLMLKYYEYLLRIKKLLLMNYGIDILENINDFPLDVDKTTQEYYEKIADKISNYNGSYSNIEYNDRYYIKKVKPFFVKNNIYYEVTFNIASSNTSKFAHIIAFTKKEIFENYAVKCSVHKDIISIFNKNMSILVIDDFDVSIRPCELSNFSSIFGSKENYDSNSIEYKELMHYLSNNHITLTELVCSDDGYYEFVKKGILNKVKKVRIFLLFDRCREIILENKPSNNILRYLLLRMNNQIIKNQLSSDACYKLSGLFLDFKCIPFDEMPYCSSLKNHNPRICDLLESIPTIDREHELLARYIKNNTEINACLFTPLDNLNRFKNIKDLINKYNKKLYYKHRNRELVIFKKYVYIKSYVDNCIEIIKKLISLTTEGIQFYTASVDSWLTAESYLIDDDAKKKLLRNMFADSHVALIYGSAGTGKSTLLRHISNLFSEHAKIFLANTHPAVDNIRRKVPIKNSEYMTITYFLSEKNKHFTSDILFIDECSTVSNEDMYNILRKSSFKLLVLTGDEYQIQSIRFGNWFSIAKKIVNINSVFELTHPYRASNKNLLLVWDRVRQLDNAIIESLVRFGYVSNIDNTLFDRIKNDEIVLCLNYDGLYGVNNINAYFQNLNTNEPVQWGINTYKVNDPILFNESNIFSPLIHNNSKGRIVKIQPSEKQIYFEIELEDSINALDAEKYSFILKENVYNQKSIIAFSISKYGTTDEDDDYNNSTLIPFQVAYAVSIHKAQGLEYNSVKIVIADEIEEQITHDIFYTAITRAKEELKIYWSAETEEKVIKNLKLLDYNKDINLIKNFM